MNETPEPPRAAADAMTEQPSASPAETGEAKSLRRRARWGVALLGARSAVQQLVILGANVYLARLLSPSDYGVFAVIQFALALFAVFGDVGFGPALIQKQELPTQRELSTVWWFQVALSSTLVGLVFLLAPYLLRLWRDLPPGTAWLLRGMSLNFLFTVLRVIPSLKLERSLKFGWLSALEVAQTVAFYGTALVMAHRGAGPASFVTASVVQAGMTALLLNLLSPWRPSLAFDRTSLRSILHFGLPFQGKTMLGLANVSVMPLIAGTLLGKQALGLLNFAQKTAYFPLELVLIVSRVAFPVLSRLQGNRATMAREIESNLRLCGAVTHLFVGLCLGLGPALVGIIYSPKWLPAVPLLYVYALAMAIGFVSPVLNAALEASGRPDLVVKMVAGWTLFNWVAVLIGTSVVRNPLAFTVANSLYVLAGNLLVLEVVRRKLPEVRLGRGVRGSLAGGLAVACGGRLVLPWVESAWTLAASVLGSALLFLVVACVLDRELLDLLQGLWRRWRPTRAGAAEETA